MKRLEILKKIKPKAKTEENNNNNPEQEIQNNLVQDNTVLDLSNLNHEEILSKLFDTITNKNITSLLIDNDQNDNPLGMHRHAPFNAPYSRLYNKIYSEG